MGIPSKLSIVSFPLILVLVGCSGTDGVPIPEARTATPETTPDPSASPREPTVGATSNDAPTGPTSTGDAGVISADASATDAGRAKDGAVIVPGLPAIEISEVYVDAAGVRSGSEYVELRGAPGSPLRDLRLRTLSANGTVVSDVAVASRAPDTLGATGLYVVGGPNVGALGASYFVDRELIPASFSLDDTGGSVQLLAVQGGQRILVDVVGYSTKSSGGAPPAPAASPPSTTVHGTPVVVSAAKKSVGRRAMVPTTGNNRSDFCTMAPTPGFPPSVCQ